MSNIIVTSHAKRRVKSRLGIQKHLIEELSQEAYDMGIKHKETKGALNRYITGLYLKNKVPNNCRIYKEKIFLFHGNILITIIDLPNRFKGKYIKGDI